MKRTAAITLLTLGAGAVTIYSLTGENRGSAVPDDGAVFVSKEQCLTSGGIAPDDCTRGWDAALQSHQSKAPHFATTAECEKVYGSGKCTVPSGASTSAAAAAYVIPAMAAYMIGRSWTAEGCPPAPLLRQRDDAPDRYRFPGSYPGCRARTGSSAAGFLGHGWWRTSPAIKVGSPTRRGGFGLIGRSFSFSSAG